MICVQLLSVSLIPVFWIRWPTQIETNPLYRRLDVVLCCIKEQQVYLESQSGSFRVRMEPPASSFCELVSSTTGMESRRVQLQLEEPRRLLLLIWLIAWWLSGISSKNAAFRRALSISSSSHLVKIQSLLTSPPGTLGEMGAFQGTKIPVSLLNNRSQIISCF